MGSFDRRGFADQLSIDTPEQVALELPVAGIGSRFVALLLDHLIQAAILLIFLLLLVILSAAIGHRGGGPRIGDKWLGALVIVAFFLIFWGYYVLFETYWHGQTPGKRVMHLRVIKDTGRQITGFESMARNLLRVVDYMPSLYLAGVITMLCNRRNKRLGDLAAGTMVVHEIPAQQPLWSSAPPSFAAAPVNPWQPGVETGPPLFPAESVSRLGQEDLRVIETFFARALDLSLDTRATMAHRILGELSARMQVMPPEGNPERALEALAVQLRARGRSW